MSFTLWIIKVFFFNWLFIVALTARSYRDCQWFSVLGMVLYWYFEPQKSQMRFFLIHGRHLSGRVQCSHRAKSATWTTMSYGNPVYHESHLSGRVQCSHRATAVSNVVTGPLPTIWIKRPGNPIYELLYEFKIHCHLLGNLSIRSSPFWQQWFQDHEKL